MNFECNPPLPPIRVVMVNPLSSSSQMALVKMLSGGIFGKKQLVDTTLLVYSNEMSAAESFIQELIGCGFGCLNSVVATSDLSSITDADIICIMTDFPNPNLLDFENLDTEDQFDSFYLTIKVANSLGKLQFKSNNTVTKTERIKPIIVTDGLIALEILNIIAKNNISSNCFSPTGIPAVAKSVLGEYLKVQRNEINRIYVWGANDLDFHVEIVKPFVLYDTINDKDRCDWEMVSKDLLEPLNLDHTRFNASWMQKEYIEKLRSECAANPYGNIYKSWQLADVLSVIWKAHCGYEPTMYKPLGVISDGSVGTVKGLPYVLPILLSGGTWKVDKHFEELSHVRQKIKRYNEIVKKNHEKLVKYCNKFLTDNVINQAFVPADEDSDFTYSSLLDQSDQQ